MLIVRRINHIRRCFKFIRGDPREDGWVTVAGLVAEGKAAGPKRRTFVFVNNPLKANALGTIAAMLDVGG
jgi:hypothetical protein